MRAYVGVLLLIAAVLGAYGFSGSDPYHASPCRCDQDVAAATWFALQQVDCDGEETGAPCTDDLADVNVAPTVTAERLSDGRVVVHVTVLESGAPALFVFRFTRDGSLL